MSSKPPVVATYAATAKAHPEFTEWTHLPAFALFRAGAVAPERAGYASFIFLGMTVHAPE
jgi:hypothetical protein